MWDWINCHVAQRHEFVVWTDSNAMFLRCLRCGRRSNGWRIAAASGDGIGHDSRTSPQHRHGLLAEALALLGLAHAER